MIEINGDKIKKDDSSIKCCLAKMDDNFFNVIYVNRRNDLEENIANNFGMISPEGYRKANRFIKLSEKLSTPIVLFVDTPGANAGIDAEMNGQAVAIARQNNNIYLLYLQRLIQILYIKEKKVRKK